MNPNYWFDFLACWDPDDEHEEISILAQDEHDAVEKLQDMGAVAYARVPKGSHA